MIWLSFNGLSFSFFPVTDLVEESVLPRIVSQNPDILHRHQQQQQLSGWIMGGRPPALGCGSCMRQKFHKNTSSEIHVDREQTFPILHCQVNCHVIILDLTTLVCNEHSTTQLSLVKQHKPRYIQSLWQRSLC